MSLRKTCTVWCDGPGKALSPDCRGWAIGCETGADARRAAKSQGWLHVAGQLAGATNRDRAGYDLCPACRQVQSGGAA